MSTNAPYGERRTSSSRFLPPDPGVEAPYRLTPGLAFRVGVLGIVALAVFAVLFFRLWSLQVLSGEQHLANAQGNQLRTIRIEAPRGTILDRRGIVHSFSGHPAMFGLFFAAVPPDNYRDWKRSDYSFYDALARHLHDCGVICEPDSREPLFMCAAHDTACLADTLRAFETAVDRTLEQVEAEKRA